MLFRSEAILLDYSDSGFSIKLLTEDNDLQSCGAVLPALDPGGQLIVSTYFPREFLESGKDGGGLARANRNPLRRRNGLEPFRVGRSIAKQRFSSWKIGFSS